MKQLLLVFIGGGTGSIFRYVISKYLNDTTSVIPWGTLAANVFGSLCIGIILGMITKNNLASQHTTLLLSTGFCGGLTTFSTFAYENHLFLKSGDFITFLLYTTGTFILGICCVFLGMFLTNN